MKLLTILLTLGAAASIHGHVLDSHVKRSWSRATDWGKTSCLTDDQANSIVAQYATLLTDPQGPNFNATIETLTAENFVAYSDSINQIAGKPLGTASIPSKLAFMARHTPPIPTVDTLEIIHNCKRIVWRWAGKGLGVDTVNGIITMNIDNNNQISTVYSEFNSGAWLVNIGKGPCNS